MCVKKAIHIGGSKPQNMASLDAADGNLECQEDELLALGSIYDERVFTRPTDEMQGQVNVYLDLPNPFEVEVAVKRIPTGKELGKVQTSTCSTSSEQTSVPKWKIFLVKYLPPLVLTFIFPPSYPSSEPPQFTLSCKWLTAIQVNEAFVKILISIIDVSKKLSTILLVKPYSIY